MLLLLSLGRLPWRLVIGAHDTVEVSTITLGEERQGDLLVLAVLSRNTNCLKILLEHRLQGNSRASGAWQFGRHTIFHGLNFKTWQLLYEAATTHPWQFCSLTSCDAQWIRPLHVAAYLGDIQAVAVLLDAGANPNLWCLEADTLKWAFSATDLAAFQGHNSLALDTLAVASKLAMGSVTLSVCVVPLGAYVTCLKLAGMRITGDDLALLARALLVSVVLRLDSDCFQLTFQSCQNRVMIQIVMCMTAFTVSSGLFLRPALLQHVAIYPLPT